jgi:hypothetical protein
VARAEGIIVELLCSSVHRLYKNGSDHNGIKQNGNTLLSQHGTYHNGKKHNGDMALSQHGSDYVGILRLTLAN